MGYFPSLYTATKAFLSISAVTICTAATLLYRYQCSLIYPSGFPSGSRTEVLTPDHYDIEYENLTLKTPDGEKLHAFLMPQQQISEKERARGEKEGGEDTMRRRPTVLVFHANAGNMGHRLPLAAVFYKRFGCNVFMLSYRGYGLSTGQASELGIRIDAQTALDYIKSHPVLKDTVIVAYGQSIGGAVAIDVASRNPKSVHALILENTFLSIPALIPHVLPLVKPFTFLCREYWSSDVGIKRISAQTPVLFLTGRQDELVPPPHMDTLIATCSSEVVVRMMLDGGNHNNTCVQPGYFEAVGLFLSTYVIPRTSGGEAAAMAAQSTISQQYQFVKADSDSSNIIDVVAITDAKSSSSASHSSTAAHLMQKNLPTEEDSDSTEWVEMSAKDAEAGSVAPQDIRKSEL
ncbi:hypothetical protein CBS101457_004056 [Exobasidium rhododendri]|nr:hypothetical protein CBS101457_004056 [Exobasidium rhododendri]